MQEILIKSIVYNTQVFVIVPVGCPGVNDENVPIYEGKPACVIDTVKCPYLDHVQYDHDNMKRTLFCNKDSVNG